MSTTIDRYDTPLAHIEVDRARRLVKLVRTAAPAAAEDMDRVADEFLLAVPLRERPRLVLLQDMRAAPPIRDDALDAALQRVAPRLFDRFLARAVLRQTAVGRLQAGRFIDARDPRSRAFTDEAEAYAFLEAALRASPPPKPSR